MKAEGPPKLVLASSSPRRKELLGHFGLPFTVQVPDVDESELPGEAPHAHVGRLAVEKAAAVGAGMSEGLVIAADTVVVLDDRIIGKPADPAGARRMLSDLAGRTHLVYTGLAVADLSTGQVRTAVVRSEVTMKQIPGEEITRYVAGGEPLDKAGAYAVQGQGSRYVASVEGSFTNVVGLPLRELRDLLALSGCALPLPDMRL